MPKKWTEVVRGSALDGGSEGVAAFAGLEIPMTSQMHMTHAIRIGPYDASA